MKRYIFKEQEISNEYRYIFLCGSHYIRSSDTDKRNVLRDFLKSINKDYCPIILEDSFMFRNEQSRYLFYDDIYMKDLYQVEMVTNYLSDNNIIIHESISTAAETGLFLSEKNALKKTCLLLPDKIAIEENKLGQFIRLAFMRYPDSVDVINFYPKIEKKVMSNDVTYWHTYFYENKIGTQLGTEILRFLEREKLVFKIRFSQNKKKIQEGFIHYKKKNNNLEITLLPRILLNCIVSIFNIKELSKQVFNAEEKELQKYIDDIKMCLYQVFINTIEEKTGDAFTQCSIHAEMNIRRVYISGMIGMCLYFFQAAGFIEIVKADDYAQSNKVKITRKMITDRDEEKHFFYEKYRDCIDCAIPRKIV